MATAMQYTGHGAKTGGLQAHSIGGDYPYVIAATANRRWLVIDARTGNESSPVLTYNEARQQISSLRLRNMMHA